MKSVPPLADPPADGDFVVRRTYAGISRLNSDLLARVLLDEANLPEAAPGPLAARLRTLERGEFLTADTLPTDLLPPTL